jgi:FkbM family methyltransferase
VNLRYFLVDAHGALPYYPGKWRIGQVLSRSCSFPETVTVRRQGTLYRLVPSVLPQRQILTDGVYEPAETKFVQKWVKPGMVALDIGAHIGYFSLLLSRLVGPTGKVHAFEPTPRTFELLMANIELNQCDNVRANNCAVGERCGAFHLVENTAYSASGTNFMDEADGSTATVTVDSLNLPQVDFIKIDTEGFEMRVLHGADQTLRRCRPAMLLEVNSDALVRAGNSARGLIDYLKELGYSLRQPTWQGLRPFHEPGPGEWPNVVAIPDHNS